MRKNPDSSLKGTSMDKKENSGEIIGHFSVALGLFDYINPIFYGVTVITIMVKLFGIMSVPAYIFFAVGAVISLVFGLSIPTVKLIVGLGKMQFKMPVNLVSFVNTKGSYTTLKKAIVRALLQADINITARQYIGYETDTGYFHYNVDAARVYEMEES